jgi:hypothetical protein
MSPMRVVKAYDSRGSARIGRLRSIVALPTFLSRSIAAKRRDLEIWSSPREAIVEESRAIRFGGGQRQRGF